MTEENRVEYLWQASCILPPVNQTNKLLKSYYLTTSQKVGKINHNLPQLKYGEAGMCRKCSTGWFDGNFKMKSIPKQVRSSKARRLINALETGKTLSRQQKNRAKWYKKHASSAVELHCMLCNNKTSVILKKTIQASIKESSKSEVLPLPMVNKKKKKKDKTAGLLLPSTKNSTNQSPLCKPNTMISTQPKQMKSQPTKPAVKILLKNNKTQKKNITKPTIVSRTQQKNSILYLVKMLKQSSSMDQNTSLNNRLQNLLQ